MAHVDRERVALPLHGNKENVPPRGKYLIGKKKKHPENQLSKKVRINMFSKNFIDLTQESSESSDSRSLEKVFSTPFVDTISKEEEPEVQNVNSTLNNSFEMMINSLLCPDRYAPNKTEASGEAPLSICESESNEANFSSKSFEIMFNSLLCPNRTGPANGKLHDSSFNELMDKILTPDLNAPKIPNNSQISQRLLQKKTNFQPNKIIAKQESENSAIMDDAHIMRWQQLVSNILSLEGSSQNSELSDVKNLVTINTNMDLGLEQKQGASSATIPCSLPPDWEKSRSITDFSGRAQSPTDGEENLSQSPRSDSKICEDDFPGSFQELSLMSSDEHSQTFNETPLSPILNRRFDQRMKQNFDHRQETGVKEMSTQTSFDLSLSQDMSSGCLESESYKLPPVRYLETSVQQTQTESNCSQKRKNPKAGRIQSEVLEGNNLRHESGIEPQQDQHILSVLSDDITTLPDGRKIYNVCKIGTAKWLLLASSRFERSYHELLKYKKEKVVKILETTNTSSLYIDYVSKVSYTRCNRGNVKVFKIEKNGSKSSNASQSFDTTDNGVEDTFRGKRLTRLETKLACSIDKICSNAELVRSDYDIKVIDKSKIRLKIHSIISQLFEVFENGQIPQLVIKNVTAGCVFENGRMLYKDRLKNIRRGAAFCRLLCLLGKISSMLQSDTKLTKREIYYQMKTAVKNQPAITGSLEDATLLLGVGQWDLNFLSNSGLVYGNLKLFWKSGEITNCNNSDTIIPSDLEDLVEVQTNASFILVLEKESIYRKLLEEDLPNKLGRPFILLTVNLIHGWVQLRCDNHLDLFSFRSAACYFNSVNNGFYSIESNSLRCHTGKGMATIATRLFLNRISRIMALPVFILVDPDAYGIQIMLTYRFGSVKNCHLADDLVVPNARWLGVFPSEISKYGIPWQNLSKRDKSLINAKLKWPQMIHYPRLKEELETLLTTDKKASIEGLIKSENFLSGAYLPMKFFNQDFV